MLYVIGSGAGKSRDEIMTVYPRHKAFLDQFVARGEVVGVGPFTPTPYCAKTRPTTTRLVGRTEEVHRVLCAVTASGNRCAPLPDVRSTYRFRNGSASAELAHYAVAELGVRL